jgi:glycosyltransferase involved in cell wall biosynthesis
MTSVTIPIWIKDEEGLQITKNCIDSIYASEGGPFEIIIIDNGSLLGGGYLRSVASIYVRFPINLGFTPAVNVGIKIANGQMIGILNNDIRVPANWATVCERILANNEQVATIHPKMQPYDEPFKFGDIVAVGGRERWCGNSFVVTSRAFLDALRQAEQGKEPFPGLLDENYGVGGGADDWDIHLRWEKLGKLCYTNKTAFQHLDSFTLKKLGAEREKIANQNNEYFRKKWGDTKENIFNKSHPGQAEEDWRMGFI